MKKAKIDIIPQESIESKIFSIRGKRVMFDRDLANLYQVETKVLNQAVKRNIQRFPGDFMFQITKEEFNSLRSHFVTRILIGHHRIVYEIDYERKIITVHKVGHRRDIYK